MKNYSYYYSKPTTWKKKIIDTLDNCQIKHPENRIWIENLYNEHFISPAKMKEIIMIVSSKFNDCLDKVELINHSYDSLCCGENCNISFGSIVVAALIPKIRFKNYLITEYRHFFKSKSVAENFIIDLCVSPLSINPKYKSISLKAKNRIIWMSWDNVNDSPNPLFFMRTNYADEARTALGLGFDEYKRKDFLAFIFPVQTNSLYRPTICDSVYNDYFRPTNISFTNHGIIKPLNSGIYKVLNKKYYISANAFYLPESINWGSAYSIKNINQCILLNSI